MEFQDVVARLKPTQIQSSMLYLDTNNPRLIGEKDYTAKFFSHITKGAG